MVTTVVAPVGAWLAQFTPPRWLWGLYLLAVAYLAWRLFLPNRSARAATSPVPGPPVASASGAGHRSRGPGSPWRWLPISVPAGLLGVGPGFLVMPTLILVVFGLLIAATTACRLYQLLSR